MSKGIKAMKKNNKDRQITLFKNLELTPFTYGTIIFNKEKFIYLLEEINPDYALNTENH